MTIFCISKSRIPAVALTFWSRESAVRSAWSAAAAAEMDKLGIPVNDLYSLIIADPEKYICGDGVHPTDEGYRMLAKQVAEKIESFL